MHIITFATQKGGTGKTTLATTLAVAAVEAGETVIMFDLDPQGSLMAWAQERGGETPKVETFPAAKYARMPEMVRSLSSRFTVAIIDTAGVDNTATHQAMEASTLCLVPLRPTRLDYNAVKPTVQALLRGGKAFAFVLNQCPAQPRNTRAAEMAASLAIVGDIASPSVLQRADFQDAYAAGKGATEYAPGGKAAEEARALWAWVQTHSKGIRP